MSNVYRVMYTDDLAGIADTDTMKDSPVGPCITVRLDDGRTATASIECLTVEGTLRTLAQVLHHNSIHQAH